MNFLEIYGKEQTITSLEILKQINFFREKEGKKKPLRHDNLLQVIRDEFEEEIQLLKIQELFRDLKVGNGATKKVPYYILTTSQAKQILLKESKFVRRAVIHYIETFEEKIKNNSLKDEREKLFLELKKLLESIKSIFGIKNYDDVSYEQLLELKQVMDKNFSSEEDREKVLKQSAIEAYYIFELDNEKNNGALVKTDYFLKELERYIHLKPMNLYVVKIKEI